MRGTLVADEPVTLVDPLARLPRPELDRDVMRTFPGRPNDGAVTWTVAPDGAVTFEARLPERYGDVGYLPTRGLFANAGWYPQPVGEDGLPRVATWDVRVALPPGETGVLNGTIGEGEVAWRGEADRAALAVPRDAVVTRVPIAGGEVRLVEHRRHERRVARVLARIAEAGWPAGIPADLTIVETLDLQRFTRPAPGMLMLSDRALRLFPGFEVYHFGALRRGLFAAAAPIAEGRDRELVAAALTAELPAASPTKLLRWFAWNPIIDALLHDGTLPYYSDVFGEPFAEVTGLWEGLDPRLPGTALADQLDDLLGPGAAARLSARLVAGEPLAEAAAAMGVPAEVVAGWGLPYPRDQDYAYRKGEVVRDAPPDAPAEVVVVKADGAALPPWVAGPGPDALPLDAKRVDVDPDGHTSQAEYANDRFPGKWGVVVNAGFYALSPSQGSFTFEADLVFRRHDDTRNVWFLSATHDAQDLVGAEVGYLRYVGPLLDRRTRQHRIQAWGGPALLDPAFRPTEDGAVALGGGVSYTWDTRTDMDFALEGHRVQLAAGGGFVPGSDETWASASVLGLRLFPLHPRHVIAARVKAGWASGDVEHRLLPLGGATLVRAIPETDALGNTRVVGSVEYRWVPLRNVSIPLGGNWLSELHVTPGIDVGAVERDGAWAAAAGATLGMHVAVDVLGVRPTLMGVTVARPVWTDGAVPAGTQWYIDFNHAF